MKTPVILVTLDGQKNMRWGRQTCGKAQEVHWVVQMDVRSKKRANIVLNGALDALKVRRRLPGSVPDAFAPSLPQMANSSICATPFRTPRQMMEPLDTVHSHGWRGISCPGSCHLGVLAATRWFCRSCLAIPSCVL